MSKCAHHVTEHLWRPGLLTNSMHFGCSYSEKALFRCTIDKAAERSFFPLLSMYIYIK